MLLLGIALVLMLALPAQSQLVQARSRFLYFNVGRAMNYYHAFYYDFGVNVDTYRQEGFWSISLYEGSREIGYVSGRLRQGMATGNGYSWDVQGPIYVSLSTGNHYVTARLSLATGNDFIVTTTGWSGWWY
jgi:hypothetical protein